MTSLKKLAISGAVWTFAGYGASQILRFGSNLILTRLLFPELFGLMALINIFIIGLNLFSDIGIGQSIIQNKRGDEPAFLNTAWTLQIIRGFVLWLCCALIAWPVANFYGEPQLLWLLPIVGLNTIISGFNSTALFTLNRHLAVRKLAIFELGVQTISLIVMIIWAALSRSIWALVIGGLVNALLWMIGSHLLNSGPPNRVVWDRNAVKAILSFGRWIFVSTALYFLAEQSDRLILGKLISIELLGVYGIAFTLADIPRQVLLALSSKVIFPVFSKSADLPRDIFRIKIQNNRKPVLIAMALGLTVMVSFGDILILTLYDQRYVQASWMFPLLALGIWPRILTQTIDTSLFAVGKAKYAAIGSLTKFIFMIIGLPLGFYLMGIAGAVLIVALNDLPFYGVITYGLWREKLACVKQDIQATFIFLTSLTLLVGSRIFLGWGLPINSLFTS
jgi:O-antigen/teichoic acid export membrane protein